MPARALLLCFLVFMVTSTCPDQRCLPPHSLPSSKRGRYELMRPPYTGFWWFWCCSDTDVTVKNYKVAVLLGATALLKLHHNLHSSRRQRTPTADAKDTTLIPLFLKLLNVERGRGKCGLVTPCLQAHLGVLDLFLERTHLVLPLKYAFGIMHGRKCIQGLAN